MFLLADVSLIERILKFVEPLFESWGYLIVFGMAFFERSLLVGLVVPGNAVVLLGGLYAGLGDLDIAVVIALAFMGSLLGDNLGYLIGLKLGRPLVDRHGDFMRLEARVRLIEEYFERHGGATVLIARFVTFLGALVCPVAGMSRMNYRRFLSYEVAGSFAWAMAFGLLGYFFGLSRDLVLRVFNYIGNTLLIIVVALAIGAYAVHKIRGHRELGQELDAVELEEDAVEPGSGSAGD